MAVRVWDGSAADGNWNTATNWSGDTVPIAADDVVFNSGSENVSTTPSSLVTYASLTFTNDYTGLLGTESSFIIVNSTLLNIGGGLGAGSRRLNIDTGTVATTMNITDTATTGADTNRSPVRLICNSTSADIYISGSSSTVAIIDEPTDVGAIGDINISGGNVVIGETITSYTSLYVTGSSTIVTVEEPTAAQTITMDDGTVTVNGSNALAAVVIRDGIYISNSTGTITLITVRGGELDFSQSQQARTVTTLTISPLSTELKMLRGVVTLTNGIGLDTNYKDFNIKFSES
jgi:hypothetical protein